MSVNDLPSHSGLFKSYVFVAAIAYIIYTFISSHLHILAEFDHVFVPKGTIEYLKLLSYMVGHV